MANLYDVPADALIDAVAEELEDRLEQPDWAEFAKTGVNRELPPEQEDFWARRAASLLRKVATYGEPVGVERLSTEYGGATGGSNRYRVAPASRTDGSKKVIRAILQQLEDEDLIEVREGMGRDITPEGRSLLDETAEDVLEDLDRPELERYA